MKKFVALYLGPQPPREAATPDQKTIAAGMAAWSQWMRDHAQAIVDSGGPLGKTKRIAADGITDTKNRVAAYVVVEAQSHEAAARMFEGHPHFTIFPGDSVEIMECLPIPGQ